MNSKDNWDLSIQENGDYYSRLPNHIVLRPSESGSRIIEEYKSLSNQHTESVKLTNPVEFLSRKLGKNTRTGLLSKQELFETDLGGRLPASLTGKLKGLKVRDLKAEKLQISELKGLKYLDSKAYAEAAKHAAGDSIWHKGYDKYSHSPTLSGSSYHGTIIATPKKGVKSPSTRDDYNLMLISGYRHALRQVKRGNLRGQKEWLVYYAD